MAIREYVEHPVTIEYTIRVGRGRKGVLAKGRATLPTPLPVTVTPGAVEVSDDGLTAHVHMHREADAEAIEAEVNARVGNMLAGWLDPITVPTSPEEGNL